MIPAYPSASCHWILRRVTRAPLPSRGGVGGGGSSGRIRQLDATASSSAFSNAPRLHPTPNPSPGHHAEGVSSTRREGNRSRPRFVTDQIILVQVLPDLVGGEQRLDAVGLLERLVRQEADVGPNQVYRLGYLATDIALSRSTPPAPAPRPCRPAASHKWSRAADPATCAPRARSPRAPPARHRGSLPRQHLGQRVPDQLAHT